MHDLVYLALTLSVSLYIRTYVRTHALAGDGEADGSSTAAGRLDGWDPRDPHQEYVSREQRQ